MSALHLFSEHYRWRLRKFVDCANFGDNEPADNASSWLLADVITRGLAAYWESFGQALIGLPEQKKATQSREEQPSSFCDLALTIGLENATSIAIRARWTWRKHLACEDVLHLAPVCDSDTGSWQASSIGHENLNRMAR